MLLRLKDCILLLYLSVLSRILCFIRSSLASIFFFLRSIDIKKRYPRNHPFSAILMRIFSIARTPMNSSRMEYILYPRAEIVFERQHKLFSDEVENADCARKIYDIDFDVPANHVPRCWHRYARVSATCSVLLYCEMRNLSSNMRAWLFNGSAPPYTSKTSSTSLKYIRLVGATVDAAVPGHGLRSDNKW